MKDKHAAGEGGSGCGAGSILQRPLGKHPNQSGCEAAGGQLRSAASQPQTLYGGPAVHHGKRH